LKSPGGIGHPFAFDRTIISGRRRLVERVEKAAGGAPARDGWLLEGVARMGSYDVRHCDMRGVQSREKRP
jgi:hypothetical protein